MLRRIRHDPHARLAIVSLRLGGEAFRAAQQEQEDVWASLDGADVYTIETASLRRRGYRAAAALARRVRLPPPSGLDVPGPRLERTYDVMVVVCINPSDLLHFAPVGRWRRQVGRLYCHVEELWAASLPGYVTELDLLSEFDVVSTGLSATREPLARRLSGPPVAWIPAAVDARRFVPASPPPFRGIDVYNMGRRSPKAHAAFGAYARSRDWLYLHDTFRGAGVRDLEEHRALLASLVQRTRFFVTNKAAVDRADLRAGQEEVGTRFYEGAMAGAVMIGEAPPRPVLERLFPWKDAVIHLPFDAEDVSEALESVDASRAAEISERNVRESVCRHDWAHRWEKVLELLRLDPRPGLARRLDGLESLSVRPRLAA